MFAVIILGIGFIMVAALFPVAIRQTQATSEDVTASGYAPSISQMLPAMIISADVPPTGQSSAGDFPAYASFGNIQAEDQAAPYPGTAPNSVEAANAFAANPLLYANWTLWSKISGSMIHSNDSRYGWVGFYSRDESVAAAPANPVANPYINVVAVITQDQNTQGTGYTANDLIEYSAGAPPEPVQPATLQGWPAAVRIMDSSDTAVNQGLATTDLIMISKGNVQTIPTAIPSYYDAAATGAYVVISQDKYVISPNPSPPPATLTGHFNGQIFRIGARRLDLDPTDGSYQVWELQPGRDYTPEATTSVYYTPTIPGGISGTMPNGVTGGWSYAFVVGRQLTDPTAKWSATNPFTGNSQAIAAYSFTIPVQ